MDLAAVAAIERLKYRYLRALDTKSWTELSDTMMPDATAVYGEHLSFESRDAFIGFLENTLGTLMVTEHHCSHPEIEISADGTRATGVWLLADTVMVPEDGILMRGSAHYYDRYVLSDDGKWRICHTGYERNWESVSFLSDLPNFRLNTNRRAMLSNQPRAS